MKTRKLAAALAFAGFALSLDCAAADAYRIRATLLHGGERFAVPSAVVAAGTPATLEVAGDAGYRLSLGVEELADGKLKLDAGLESPYGAMSPVLVVKPGEPATVTVGDLGMVVTVEREAPAPATL